MITIELAKKAVRHSHLVDIGEVKLATYLPWTLRAQIINNARMPYKKLPKPLQKVTAEELANDN